MDTLMNIFDNLWITYKTMVAFHFIYWIVLCVRMHDTDILNLYQDVPNKYMKWTKYIWECLSGSFVISLIWPYMTVKFTKNTLKESMSPIKKRF